jgi:DNA-binding response OmpR family regulator
MRKIREQSDVPVIYITANPDPHYRGQAKRTDFSDYLYKPVKFSELRNAVKNVLGKNEKRNGVMKSVLKRIGLAF